MRVCESARNEKITKMRNISREGSKDAGRGTGPSAKSLVSAYRQLQLVQGWAQITGDFIASYF